ncbi:XS domain-containing protein [Artemisia annua]|uniref:XS domain-containing protein n=1 Tax=Artemisia annua TaxID=35608 RepID=A0A2U1KET5_ARTAN|nr:XS domain-containing protein [Artemisia annua]
MNGLQMSANKGKDVASISGYEVGWAVFPEKKKHKGGNVAAATSIQALKTNPWVQPAGRGDVDKCYDNDKYDSDESQTSNEERKNNKWYCEFFITLDKLTAEQIDDPKREWHCPACKNGPCVIRWYKSLQSLVIYAKTKVSKSEDS